MEFRLNFQTLKMRLRYEARLIHHHRWFFSTKCIPLGTFEKHNIELWYSHFVFEVLTNSERFRATKPVNHEYVFDLEFEDPEVMALRPPCWSTNATLVDTPTKWQSFWVWVKNYLSSPDALWTRQFEQSSTLWSLHQVVPTKTSKTQPNSVQVSIQKSMCVWLVFIENIHFPWVWFLHK